MVIFVFFFVFLFFSLLGYLGNKIGESMIAPDTMNPMLAPADWNNDVDVPRGDNNMNDNNPQRQQHQEHHRHNNDSPINNTNNNNHASDPSSGRVSRLYGWLSFTGALIAVCTTAQTAELVTPRSSSLLSRGWITTATTTTTTTIEPVTISNSPTTTKNRNNYDNIIVAEDPPPLPAWLRWALPIKAVEVGEEKGEYPSAQQSKKQTDVTCNGENKPILSMVSSPTAWLEAGQSTLESLIDPSLLNPSPHTFTDLIDKILTSTPRLLAMANFLLSLTYLLHTTVADCFLGRQWASRPEWQHREKLGGFLVFKLLLISAVVAPDTLDLLILLSWYTLLSFLRSLSSLCANAIQHCTAAGQAPPQGVLRLLSLVWMSNILAAAVCVALFHAAGAGMVWLLTCDCALLGVDVIGHLLQHLAAAWEVAQAAQLNALEEQEEVRLRNAVASNREGQNNIDENDNDDDDDNGMTRNQVRIQRLEDQHSRRMRILDSIIFATHLLSHILTVAHFFHIWSLHGLQLTLIDGVLALHLHSAISSASRQIAHRRNLHRIARHLDSVFADATELELRKHTTDVCCVCLGGLSAHVKKVACGHLYHAHCLREVVERARSMETAKCPLCRAYVLDGSRNTTHTPRNTTIQVPERDFDDAHEEATVGIAQQVPPLPQQQQQQQQRQEALFRFSTDAILPAWIPIPNFSFEIVRRPAPTQPQAGDINNNTAGDHNNPETSWIRRLLLMAGVVPMSPAEEATAIEHLVDMFPQYDRSDLLRELRQRGSIEGVTEAILTGLFTGISR